jgi:hypothetical protein
LKRREPTKNAFRRFANEIERARRLGAISRTPRFFSCVATFPLLTGGARAAGRFAKFCRFFEKLLDVAASLR